MKGKIENKCIRCGNTYFGKACDVKTGRSKFCSVNCRQQNRSIPIIERFWAKVKKTDTCWNWTASVNTKGYGSFDEDCGFKNAHRYSYFLHFGKIPCNMLVCHTCDNPKCVNPNHLFIGTIADNNKDKVEKSRQAKGSKSGMSKLKEDEIPKIRIEIFKKIPLRTIAKHFNVTKSTISAIKYGKTWCHV